MDDDCEPEIRPQFIMGADGKPQAVLLSIADFELLMDQLEDVLDAQAYDRAVEQSTGLRPMQDVVADLIRDGLLPAGNVE